MSEEMFNRYRMHLRSNALDLDALQVVRVTGRDELTRLFEFTIDVRTTSIPMDLGDFQPILDEPAVLSWGEPVDEHPIHGVIAAIEMLPGLEAGHTIYRLTLVPKLWQLTLTCGSWVYLDMTVEEIVTDVLEEAGFERGKDFDFQLHDDAYLKREFTLQYEESDYAFIARLCEHVGIGWLYEHGDAEAKLIFTDSNQNFRELTQFETITHDPRGDQPGAQEVFTGITGKLQRVSQTVKLKDYNYRTPSVPIEGESEIDAKGIGTAHIFGEHATSPSEAVFLSSVRAEQALTEKLRMQAKGRVRGLRPGHHFALLGSVMAGLDREYLVTAIEHIYEEQGSDGSLGYTNRVELQPLEIDYRPARVTPRPKIYSVVHAVIDGEGDGDGVHTPLDDWGRYKVVLPFDVAGEEGGKASHWIRKAQAHAGPGWGSHVPLHKGTEVAIYFINGDPDRPCIAAALPNFEHSSPVAAENSNVSMFRTRGGILYTVAD